MGTHCFSCCLGIQSRASRSSESPSKLLQEPLTRASYRGDLKEQACAVDAKEHWNGRRLKEPFGNPLSLDTWNGFPLVLSRRLGQTPVITCAGSAVQDSCPPDFRIAENARFLGLVGHGSPRKVCWKPAFTSWGARSIA